MDLNEEAGAAGDAGEEGGQILVSRPRIRSVLERYYRTFLVTDCGGPGEDYLVHLHTNRAMIATLAPSHVLVKALRESLLASAAEEAGSTSKVPLFIAQWNWRHHVSGLIPRTTARGNPVLAPGMAGAKRQRSAAPKIPCFQKDSILATAITSDGRAWPIRTGIKGYPVEINTKFMAIHTATPPPAVVAHGGAGGGGKGSSSSGGGGRWVKSQATATAAPVAAPAAETATEAAVKETTSTETAEGASSVMHVDGDGGAQQQPSVESAAAEADEKPKAAPITAQHYPRGPKPKKLPTPDQASLTALVREKPHTDAFVALFTHPNRHKAAAMPFEAPGVLVTDIEALFTTTAMAAAAASPGATITESAALAAGSAAVASSSSSSSTVVVA
jgi:hypothetical protein